MHFKKYDIYCAIFWLLLSVFVCGISLLDLGLGTLSYPAPGFFPFFVSFLLLSTSIFLIINAFIDKKKESEFQHWPKFGRNVPITLGALLSYALILDFLGYIISTSLLLIFLFKYTASRKWWISLVMTSIIIICSYYFFVVLLDSQLPAGILENTSLKGY